MQKVYTAANTRLRTNNLHHFLLFQADPGMRRKLANDREFADMVAATAAIWSGSPTVSHHFEPATLFEKLQLLNENQVEGFFFGDVPFKSMQKKALDTLAIRQRRELQ